ncbi:protein WVD2-like 7 [Solanum dulcamara]|uniref:protein WVD2-like 7 n=1 Tax=Solanum dulcamara TaxID=45834 RepID=UPI002484D8A9|nr:protein WVD2-like 7 [Solanum dulcamara]
MDESNGSGPTLEVSVSFGKYENDALSWEKWSSFSPNKYLEEAEKCKTYGSVAQKKAYFEAHYKKIAAQKMEQEKKEQLEQVESLDKPHFQDRSESTQVFDTERSATEGEEEMTTPDVNNSDSVDVEVNSLLVLKAEEGEILETSDHGEVVPSVEQQTISERGSQHNVKEIPQVDNEAKRSSAKKSKTPKPNLKNTARKIHPTTEDRISAGTKKKPASPVTKTSIISTPTSKPIPTSKIISSSQTSVKKVNGVSYQRSSNAPVAQSNKVLSRSLISPSQSSIKKLNGSTLQRGKNFPTLENKRIAPKSLHMSLSLGPQNSTASASTMRKSFIMERMGDKDIVKRAFKAFQNSFNQGKNEVDKRYGGSKKVLPKGSEQKISASPTPKKEVERLRKTSDTVVTQKCQSGTRSNSLSSRVPKDAGIERKKVNTVRPAGTSIDRSIDKLKEDIIKGKIHRAGSNR